MNTQSNAARESLIADQAAPAVMSPTRPLYWSVRRELWESRSIYIAPLTVAALVVLGFVVRSIRLPQNMRLILDLTPAEQQIRIQQPYTFAGLLLMGVTFIVAIIYCLDALYGERRDRSILFWKSMPVSDTTTVLSKAAIPVVVIPLLTFAITVVTQVIMVVIESVALSAGGLSVATFWARLSLFDMWVVLLNHLVTGHGLWYAPLFGYLLLASAWARRAPFLWAGLPLLVFSLVEKITFNTWRFAHMLSYRLVGGPDDDAFGAPGRVGIHSMAHIHLGRFFASPGLWIGLAVTAVFLALAIRLRRYRGPI